MRKTQELVKTFTFQNSHEMPERATAHSSKTFQRHANPQEAIKSSETCQKGNSRSVPRASWHVPRVVWRLLLKLLDKFLPTSFTVFRK